MGYVCGVNWALRGSYRVPEIQGSEEDKLCVATDVLPREIDEHLDGEESVDSVLEHVELIQTPERKSHRLPHRQKQTHHRERLLSPTQV